VVLNITGPEELEAAFLKVIKQARLSKPDALIEGVLVQEMLKQGLEVIVGVKQDPVFGPAVVVGLGGIFVEVLKDAATRIAPLREADAWEMLSELKGKALFEGVRGQQPRDTEALVSILLKVSRMAVELDGLIGDMDLNPLIVYEKGAGAVAADALIIRKA
jgi:acyl-CoA synthetase (NDP forming)